MIIIVTIFIYLFFFSHSFLFANHNLPVNRKFAITSLVPKIIERLLSACTWYACRLFIELKRTDAVVLILSHQSHLECPFHPTRIILFRSRRGTSYIFSFNQLFVTVNHLHTKCTSWTFSFSLFTCVTFFVSLLLHQIFVSHPFYIFVYKFACVSTLLFCPLFAWWRSIYSYLTMIDIVKCVRYNIMYNTWKYNPLLLLLHLFFSRW